MKHMMMGLFLMLVSIWCIIFGFSVKLLPLFVIGGWVTIPAVIFFLVGYFGKDKK